MTETPAVTLRAYDPSLIPVFDRLNRAWIAEFFEVEPFDHEVLTRPDVHILAKGGELWFAARGDDVIAACALMPYAEGVLEFTKLGVDPAARGRGVARTLLRHCMGRAIALGAHTLKIFTSTKLAPANALYVSEGFQAVPMSAEQLARYKRGDIMYDLAL